MSLQFIFGNSGSGKSDYLYEYVLREAAECSDQNFLILVPEQFTMQTQRELVLRDENHAIMNVEVLSFARLAYRVFDELGRQDLVILEETGKNLVLRRVAEEKKGELRVLGGNMNRMGYVGEVKSFLSELTQYNISPEELENFLRDESVGEALRLKLSDILVMYRGFRDYMEGRFITSEEVLSLLCEVAGESGILRDSVIVFDEFTGFTPIQNRLMRKLLAIAERVMVSVTMDTRENFYHSRGVHELFAMSKKTVSVLLKLAESIPVAVEEPIVLEPGEKKRYCNAPELFFMEQNLFRPACRRWEGKTEQVSITELKSPREELTFVAREIARLVRQKGYRYRDFAVVTGDVPQYANHVPEIFEQYAIPCFIDQTRNILFHPFLEFIRATLEVVESDFSYQSIFRFLRSGLSGIEEADIDCLENYVLARGIRGRKRWSEPWTFVLAQGGALADAAEGEMLRLNEIRERLAEMFAPLFEVFRAGHTVADQTYALYQFITSLEIEAKLAAKKAEFEAYAKQNRGDRTSTARAQEYAQIYKIVMELFDKVAALLGEETLSIREYGEILDAGFDAAKVGIIPPGNDRVTIGDIERTRLNHVKVLFFIGVNDGVVPKAGNTGSIISQFEREKMAEHHLELAPGAREKVFIQKFYLYLNMTKPSDALYVTYSRVDVNGKALRRSYLIGTLFHMFPGLSVTVGAEQTAACDILTPGNAMQFFLEGLNERRTGERADADKKDKEAEALWEALLKWYLSSADFAGEAKRLLDAAYRIHTSEPIGRAVTRALYGTTLENSVTRLERFAACAFAHYLQYGLGLCERSLQEFASVDMGNIYHDALEHFAGRVRASEYTWFDLPKELQARWIEESMEDAIAGVRNAGIFEDARNRYLLLRMKETIRKTVWAMTLQVQKGKFVPEAFEVSFSRADDLKAIQFTLSDEEKMRLKGRIDRIDTYETDDKVYVRIIDYKSGNTSFSLLNLYHGLQLQLVIYLNAALELMEKRHPGKTAQTAGIFYYHIENPMVDGTGTESEEEIRQAVLSQLKLNGLVRSEQEIYRAMDTEFSGSSAVIPVAEKTDGSLRATSKAASGEEFLVMSEYVSRKVEEEGKRMMDGEIAVSPYELSDRTGCDYCPYHMVCGFDPRLPGFSYRKLEKFDSGDEILARMREEK